MPDLGQYRRRARQRSETIAEAGLEDIQFEAERRATQDTAGYIADLLGAHPLSRDLFVVLLVVGLLVSMAGSYFAVRESV